MWELDYKEGWALKSWCFQTVVLEKTFESPQTARRSNQSILKEINPDYLLERLKLIWPADVKGRLIGKDLGAGEDWGQEKGATEGEVVGWHPWLNGHKFEQTPGRLWRTGKPGVLQSMGLQRVWHDLATEQQQQQQQKTVTDFFLISWGKPIMLWTFPLALLLQCPIGFWLLCFHFHSFLCIFWFLFDLFYDLLVIQKHVI